MPEKYYLDKLYPLQDSVLRIVESVPNPFYLTGGTALSRCYLHHRYSDDLDFFCNANAAFKKHTEEVIKSLENKFIVKVSVIAPAFLQAFVRVEDVELKVDFVNDVPYRAEAPLPTPLFIRTDTWMNILSNKLSALQRQAGKDMADIIFLSRSYHFSWQKVMQHAQGKDMWVNELEIAKLVGIFEAEKFKEVNWINPPDVKSMMKDLEIISKDILLGTENSLSKK